MRWVITLGEYALIIRHIISVSRTTDIHATQMTVRTELEWGFEPTNLFEATTTVAFPDGQLVIAEGKATYALSTPVDPVPEVARRLAEDQVGAVFSVRRLLTRRSFKLTGPTVVQHQPGGGRNIAIAVGGVVAMASVGQVDLVVRGPDGAVKTDTKADRIAGESNFVSALAPKVMKSPTLRAILHSFGRSVEDPANELVHLYELRDAVSKHYGGEPAARAALGVTKQEWNELGRLANDEPLREGRHRGSKLSGLRAATDEELVRARDIARLLLERFANTV